MNQVKRYDEIYPELVQGCLLLPETTPSDWKDLLLMASSDTFTATAVSA
jgi:hypothetical protein